MLASLPNVSADLDIVRNTATCALGLFRGVVIVNWRRKVLPEDVQALVNLRNQQIKRGGLVGAIHIAEPGLPLPDEESRRLGRAGVENRAGSKAPVALTIFGEGFGASAIRSVGTAIFALRAGPPTRICATVQEAADWLAEQTCDQVDASELLRACEQLRATRPAL